MANTNPYQARQAKRRKRKPGDLPAAMRLLWTALCEAEDVLLGSEDAELTLKACHCISQCAGQFVKLLEVGDYEARLAALEATLVELRGSRHALNGHTY